MEYMVSDYFVELSKYFELSAAIVDSYWQDMNRDYRFLSDINDKVKDVPEFSGVRFVNPGQLRTYRCLLYLITRIVKPAMFLETGVHNGMGSAFILLAMEHNRHGMLCSIDLPEVVDQRILDQGTPRLPRTKSPGWIIPDNLRHRHRLEIGAAEVVLPRVLAEYGQIDCFVHDSDHCYHHIMFEIGLVWHYLKVGGTLVVDNIEQTMAFADFATGVKAPSLIVSTFKGDERTWQHGLLRKVRES